MSSNKRKRDYEYTRNVKRKQEQCTCRRNGSLECKATRHYCNCLNLQAGEIIADQCRSQQHIENRINCC